MKTIITALALAIFIKTANAQTFVNYKFPCTLATNVPGNTTSSCTTNIIVPTNTLFKIIFVSTTLGTGLAVVNLGVQYPDLGSTPFYPTPMYSASSLQNLSSSAYSPAAVSLIVLGPATVSVSYNLSTSSSFGNIGASFQQQLLANSVVILESE